jgi:serine/threonine protein kinase
MHSLLIKSVLPIVSSHVCSYIMYLKFCGQITFQNPFCRPTHPQFLSAGAVGQVYRVNQCIAVKVPVPEGDEDFEHENAVLDELCREPCCADIAQSFLRMPRANFMAFYSGGNLEQRLRIHQIRHEINSDQVISVRRKEPTHLIRRWIRQLCSATAWLESRQYAHGDIRPANLLLDSKDHLKLADFDSADKYGSGLKGGMPPYARWHSTEVGDDDNSLGIMGPVSEEFAIGSTIYYMVTGYEVYGNEWFGEEHLVEVVGRLQKKKFPTLDESETSSIVRKCWHGSFATIQQLLAAVMTLEEGKKETTRPMSLAAIRKQQRVCKQLVNQGILDKICVPLNSSS